jgi:hypothetical protein
MAALGKSILRHPRGLPFPAVPDDFEQELLSDIAEAEALGENELAAEWRLELKTYRAAKEQSLLDGPSSDGSSAADRRDSLGKQHPDQK